MEAFVGKVFVLDTSENFDEYLVFIGKNLLERTVGVRMRPEETFTLNKDGTYTYYIKTSIVSATNTFTPGVEFDEKKPDGHKVKSVITIEGNKMKHVQKESNGRVTTHIKEIKDDKMLVETTVDGFKLTFIRNYKLVK